MLLTVAIAATVVGASAAYNIGPARGNADFGTANHLFTYFGVADPQSVDALLTAAEDWFGDIDVVTSREVAVPGTVDSVEFRGLDPNGAFSSPMLALVDGRYPAGPDEVAVTNRVAERFALDIGSSFALGGEAWTVTGLVENPSDLSDEFALLAPSQWEFGQSITFLVDVSSERADSFRPPSEMQFEGNLIGSRPSQEGGFAVVMVLIVAVVALSLISLVAAAGFVAVAQRRLRQLGMLAAVGASEAHLRFVMVANGVVIGALAALLGAGGGALAWVLAAPWIEAAVGHRIERFNMPWWLLAAAAVLALLTATLAAWWPARSMARVSVVRALSGRPPASQPVRRSSALAGLLIPAGVVLLAWADPSELVKETEAFGDPLHALLIASGTLATVAGVLLAGPLAIRALAATARWLPVAMRLALRDLVRFQARSAAALAAISLALGIASALVVAAAGAAPRSDEGNLSDRQLLVWTRDPEQPAGVSPFYTEDTGDSGFSPFLPRLQAADLANLEPVVEEIAALFDDASVSPLDVAVAPDLQPDERGQLAVTLARDEDIGRLDISLVYIATPELLDRYDIDLDGLRPDTEIVTVESGDLWFPGLFEPSTGNFMSELVQNVERIDAGYTSLPGSFITPAALERRGWTSVRVGWLIESETPLTSEQLAQARSIAAESVLVIESRSGDSDLVAVGWPATAAGMFIALSVLAMTVGLIRGEALGDLRTLAATGATGSIRRSLTAFTAGALALLGALLGGAGAYLVMAALYSSDIRELSQIPVMQLAVIVLGAPLAAAAAGWLLAGREPAAIARQAIE
jgi:putative ABC transport system permease protein